MAGFVPRGVLLPPPKVAEGVIHEGFCLFYYGGDPHEKTKKLNAYRMYKRAGANLFWKARFPLGGGAFIFYNPFIFPNPNLHLLHNY